MSTYRRRRDSTRKSPAYSDEYQPRIVRDGKESPDRFPRWAFRQIDWDFPQKTIGSDRGPALHAMVEAFQTYEHVRWSELIDGEYPNCHPIDPQGLPEPAKERLRKLRRVLDAEGMFQLALGEKPRVFGFKLGEVFEVLWYDPGHLVFPRDQSWSG